MRMPLVTEEIGYAVQREMEEVRHNEYVIHVLERLEQANPCLAHFISRLSLEHNDPVAISTAAILVYRLLESQLESDSMKKEFLTSPPNG